VNPRLLVHRQQWCWLAIAALFWSGSAAALSPDLTIKELHHTAWGPGQGAPLGGAVALAQTNDGYLWMAGPGGLFRFDGIAFERVDLPHDPKLSSLSLFSVFAPRDGGLWVGFTFGGVAFLKEGHWQVFSVADGVPPGSARQFAETPDGTLWLSTNNGLARFDGARWKAVGAQMGLPAGNNSMVFVDSQGTIWAGGGENSLLFFLRPGEQRFRNQPVAAPTPWTGDGMAESSTGTVWLDAGDYLVPVAQNPPPRKPSSSSSYAGPVFDHDGALWDSLNGLRRIAHPEHPAMGSAIHLKDIADAYTDVDGLTARVVLALLADREGNVWVGTIQGLDRFSEPTLKAPLQSVEFSQILAMGAAPADDAGSLWVTNALDAVVRYQDGKMSPPIIRKTVQTLFRAADGTVWFGGRQALWRVRQGHLESVAPPGPDRNTQALAQDKSGGLWASVVGSGTFRLKDGVWTPYGGIAELPRGTPMTIERDRRDRLWFSYPSGSVAVLDGERVRTYGVADGLRVGNVMANHPGRIDHWLGGEFGLARFDGERFYSVQSAPDLPLDGITGIVETTDGDLWLNGRSGIVHIAATELERSRLDPAYRVRGETLDAFDGVVGSGAILRPLPTAIEAAHGKLWFTTSGGIYGIDPARRAHNLMPPPVLIRALNVAGNTIVPIPGLTLPVYTTAVRFDYTALSLTAAEKVRYRYRLDGIDTDWRELTAARQALYTNLRPGHYSFRVIAANNDGVWNESGASLAFVIPPAFVQTGWFIALCVAGGAAAVWALVRVRVRQVRRRLEERMELRVNERTRIARDLHDTFLQTIQGSKLVADDALSATTDPSHMRQAMEKLSAWLARATEEGRAALNSLRTSATEVNDLAGGFRRALEECRIMHSSMEVSLQASGQIKEMYPIVRDEVYRIGHEAIRNACVHSRATQLRVELSYAQDLSLRIYDNGVGIDPDIVNRGKQGHFGLQGMRERAERIMGKFSVESSAGSGTVITLTVSGGIIYRTVN
jgi:signal transduction histidine kinase/streptogramin lyase